MKIGDECYVHGYVDEIRNDTIIIRNEGGYFGTAKSEVLTAPAEYVRVVRCKDCKHRDPEDHKCDCGHDIYWQLPREDKWFCADAERKEE